MEPISSAFGGLKTIFIMINKDALPQDMKVKLELE